MQSYSKPPPNFVFIDNTGLLPTGLLPGLLPLSPTTSISVGGGNIVKSKSLNVVQKTTHFTFTIFGFTSAFLKGHHSPLTAAN